MTRHGVLAWCELLHMPWIDVRSPAYSRKQWITTTKKNNAIPLFVQKESKDKRQKTKKSNTNLQHLKTMKSPAPQANNIRKLPGSGQIANPRLPFHLFMLIMLTINAGDDHSPASFGGTL